MIGDCRKYVSALIVPAFDQLEKWAAEKGIDTSSRERLLTDPRVIAMMEKRIAALEKGLAPYEKIKRFTLMPREFTMDSGELTNTLKIKRRVISERYADVIENMYR